MKLFISGAVTGNGDEFWLRPELATSKEPFGGRNWWEYQGRLSQMIVDQTHV
jgi:hypothetical protein